MPELLMPRATARWLVDHSSLTFRQIAAFCELHELEVQKIADGEDGANIIGQDPIAAGVLTKAEIERCQADENARLVMVRRDLPTPARRTKGPRYTPIVKRNEKPAAISWLLKTHKDMTDAQIAKLIGTTKATIQSIRDGTHIDSATLKPNDPVLLGLCTTAELNAALEASRQQRARAEAQARRRAGLPPLPPAAGGDVAAADDADEAAPALADADPDADLDEAAR